MQRQPNKSRRRRRRRSRQDKKIKKRKGNELKVANSQPAQPALTHSQPRKRNQKIKIRIQTKIKLINSIQISSRNSLPPSCVPGESRRVHTSTVGSNSADQSRLSRPVPRKKKKGTSFLLSRAVPPYEIPRGKCFPTTPPPQKGTPHPNYKKRRRRHPIDVQQLAAALVEPSL